MKFGIFLSAQQTLDANLVEALHDQIALVRLARDKGWDSFFTGQHYLSEGDVQHLQNLPFLARLKAEAGDMTLGNRRSAHQPSQPGLRGGDRRHHGRHRGGKHGVRRRPGLPRR